MRVKIMLLCALYFSLAFSCSSLAQSSNNTFLEYRLGLDENLFLHSNPEAKIDAGAFWVLCTKLVTDGMNFYTIGDKVTSSGIKVDVVLGFYREKLAIIDVTYLKYLPVDDLIDGLNSKYGRRTDYTENEFNDWISGNVSRVEHVYWENSKGMIIDLYLSHIGKDHVIFADKAIQKQLVLKKRKKNSKLFE
jgi:hypothetical protein